MNTHSHKSPEKKNEAHANHLENQSENNEASTFQDNRPETLKQRKLQQSIRSSSQLKQANTLQAMANSYASKQQPGSRDAVELTAVHKNAEPGADHLQNTTRSWTNEPPAQAFFDLTEFEFARNAFATCYDNATRFRDELVDLGNAYWSELDGGDTLKNNIEAKGRKASGTVSGESFESREWCVIHPNVDPHIIGPGGGHGIDLRRYDLDTEDADFPMDMNAEIVSGSVEITNEDGDAYGEVKSARSQATFLDGVGSALNDSNADRIVVYCSPNAVPALNHTFIRGGNNFVIRGGGVGGNTRRALIIVKSFPGATVGNLSVHDN